MSQSFHDDRVNTVALTTEEQILDELTKKFIFKGKPLRVKSRGKVKYDWTNDKKLKNYLEINKFLLDFISNEMPEIQNKYSTNTSYWVVSGILDMLESYGVTTNGIRNRVLKAPNITINTHGKRQAFTVGKAVEEILKKYDVNLAVDGSFLVFTRLKDNSLEDPIGGLGPVYKTAAIIESECGYPQPECELIIDVTRKLFDIAKAKPEKPYIFNKENL